MALLAASRAPPGVSSLTQHSDVLSVLSPLVNTALQFQQLVGSAAFHLAVRAYFAAAATATLAIWVSWRVIWHALVTSRLLAAHALLLLRRLIWAAWDSRSGRRLRKRLEYEIMVTLLGPGGNTLLLMLFWPGWFMIGVLWWGMWLLTG
jgi:hypothetical protein